MCQIKEMTSSIVFHIASDYICLEAYLARWSHLLACDFYFSAKSVEKIEYISVISSAKLRYKIGRSRSMN